MFTGVDVSYWQGAIDWAAVRAAGHAFAICKATESTTYADPTFLPNIKGAQATGMAVGAYHFFRMAAPAAAQADFFLNKTAGVKLDLPPVLDFEDTPALPAAAVAAAVRAWLERVEQGSGRRPIVYTSYYFWNSFAGSPAWSVEYPLWVANYTQAPQPLLPPPWKEYVLWQHSENGTAPGIAGNVDLNRCPLSEEDYNILYNRTDQPKDDEQKKTGELTLEERVARLEEEIKALRAILPS